MVCNNFGSKIPSFFVIVLGGNRNTLTTLQDLLKLSLINGRTMNKSQENFEKAKILLPGGVNSPVRDFRRVGGEPIFVEKAKGAYLCDVDGNKYIDYVGSWGPMILGHAHPKVVSAIQKAAESGLSFGAPTEIETQLAEKISHLMPSLEMLRMVSSGTEATMSAIRLARGYTKRDKIVKFEGCYHGHSDSLLVKAGSGALTLGTPDSAGVPLSFAQHTLTLEYNDPEKVRSLFTQMGDEIAAIIVEPIAGNMGCIPPVEGFLSCLREVCDHYGSVLIFDEVMTGFRVHLGGAQTLYNVSPDLTTLGKVIGGGMPVGCFGGRRDIMEKIAPLGDVYQAGTLSGNPVAMAAGFTTLSLISEKSFFEEVSVKTKSLVTQLKREADARNVPFSTNQVGGMFGIFFTESDPVRDFSQVLSADDKLFKKFFVEMLKQGIYFAPSPFEAGFLSNAHGETEINETLKAASLAFSLIAD